MNDEQFVSFTVGSPRTHRATVELESAKRCIIKDVFHAKRPKTIVSIACLVLESLPFSTSD